MLKRLIIIACLMTISITLLFVDESQALPSFARKYSADCTMCHIQVPKLNRLGYEFRLAGYRLPSEIGKEEKAFNLGNYFSGRLQMQYQWLKHEDVSGLKDSTSSDLEFHEFTIYPLTGSWGKYFASYAEFSMSPDDVFEVENAFIRGVYGNENGWLQARIGIMHPWEGYSASDRPLGNNRPLFETVPAIGSPYFPWTLDEMAVEAGYNLAKTGTTIAARLSNGILWKEDGSGVAEAAQGGGLTKPKDTPGANDKDFQIFLNQFFTNDSSVSVVYYWGVTPFPDPNHVPAPSKLTRDTFYRISAYANYFVLPRKLNLLAGYEFGNDSLKDPSVETSDGEQVGSDVGNSKGFFGEINYHAIPNKLAFGGRYDFYDPSKKVGHNSQNAFSIFGNWYIWHGLQLIGDYWHRDTYVTSGETKEDDRF
jgi:hypothetical protein